MRYLASLAAAAVFSFFAFAPLSGGNDEATAADLSGPSTCMEGTVWDSTSFSCVPTPDVVEAPEVSIDPARFGEFRAAFGVEAGVLNKGDYTVYVLEGNFDGFYDIAKDIELWGRLTGRYAPGGKDRKTSDTFYNYTYSPSGWGADATLGLAWTPDNGPLTLGLGGGFGYTNFTVDAKADPKGNCYCGAQKSFNGENITAVLKGIAQYQVTERVALTGTARYGKSIANSGDFKNGEDEFGLTGGLSIRY